MKTENKEKLKNYFKKAMFERINGVDIEKMSTSELLRQLKFLPTLFIVLIVCTILILTMTIAMTFLIAQTFEEGWYISLILFAFSFACILLVVAFPQRIKNIKAALSTREISDEIKNNAQNKISQTKKAIIIGSIAWVVVMVIFVIISASGAFSSGTWCKKCGKETKLVEGYSWCRDCYEDYFEDIDSIYGD